MPGVEKRHIVSRFYLELFTDALAAAEYFRPRRKCWCKGGSLASV